MIPASKENNVLKFLKTHLAVLRLFQALWIINNPLYSSLLKAVFMNILKNLLFFNEGILSDLILGYLKIYKEVFCLGESLVFVLVTFLLIFPIENEKARKFKNLVNEICASLGFNNYFEKKNLFSTHFD